MPDDKQAPSLKDALRETVDYDIPERELKKKPADPSYIPPPPGDWMTSTAFKSVLWVLVLGFIGVAIWKWKEWAEYFKEHSFGLGILLFAIIMVITIITVAYWRHRSDGEIGIHYMERKNKRKSQK